MDKTSRYSSSHDRHKDRRSHKYEDQKSFSPTHDHHSTFSSSSASSSAAAAAMHTSSNSSSFHSNNRSKSRRSGHRSRSRSPPHRRSSANTVRQRSNSPPIELTQEERDARTIFVWQLSKRIRTYDLETFFKPVGRVNDVRLILDMRTGKPKGIAYVEFRDVESVSNALKLSGSRLMGIPVQIQSTFAERNRINQTPTSSAAVHRKRLYVGSLNFNINEFMLRELFASYGQLEDIKLIKDPMNGRSQGFAFITFVNEQDATRALTNLNGFDLGGRAIKVNPVVDKTGALLNEDGIPNFNQLAEYSTTTLDNDQADRTGVDLGQAGRIALMAKLAVGTGLELPKDARQTIQALGSDGLRDVSDVVNRGKQVVAAAAAAAVGGGDHSSLSSSSSSHMNSASVAAQQMKNQFQQYTSSQPQVATACLVILNMFTRQEALDDENLLVEIREDVLDECRKIGARVLHLCADARAIGGMSGTAASASTSGRVFIKCADLASSERCFSVMNGRFFSGKVISINYITTFQYHQLFPESIAAQKVLTANE